MYSARDILTKAKNEAYALGAFNAGNLELVKAVVEAAKIQKAAVIIETSWGEAQYFGLKNFLDVVKNFREASGLKLLCNLDHGPGLQECQAAIEAGYDLVHFDGSKLPYEENVEITKELVKEAHRKGVLLEGEIDRILGDSSPHQATPESLQVDARYTDPQKAADFVKRTGVDILAVFVGNLHGTYRSPERIDLKRLEQLSGQLPCFLSLHGGSGLDNEDLARGIKTGRVVKINVNTQLRVAYRETLENVLKGTDAVAIYKIMPPVIAAVQKVVEEKIQLFGSGQLKSKEEEGD